ATALWLEVEITADIETLSQKKLAKNVSGHMIATLTPRRAGRHVVTSGPDGLPAIERGLAGTSSFIRTMTVGSGIAPDLLTPIAMWRTGRSRACHMSGLPPVGSFTPP